MATYIVLSAKSGPEKDPDAIFVPDSFSFLAAVFPLFWLIWHRMWLWAFCVFLGLIGASASADLPSTEILSGCAMLAISLFFGFEGRQLYIASLIRRGFSVKSVLVAPDLGTAEISYFGGATMVFSRGSPKPNPTVGKNLQGVGIFDSYGGI